MLRTWKHSHIDFKLKPEFNWSWWRPIIIKLKRIKTKFVLMCCNVNENEVLTVLRSSWVQVLLNDSSHKVWGSDNKLWVVISVSRVTQVKNARFDVLIVSLRFKLLINFSEFVFLIFDWNVHQRSCRAVTSLIICPPAKHINLSASRSRFRRGYFENSGAIRFNVLFHSRNKI